MVHEPDPQRVELSRLRAQLEAETRRADDCQRLLKARAEEIEVLSDRLATIHRNYPHLYAAYVK
jgi:hypothetical protein